MADYKAINIRLDNDIPKEKEIIDFLEDKPTSYIFKEAMELYLKFYSIKDTMFNTVIHQVQQGTAPQNTQQALSDPIQIKPEPKVDNDFMVKLKQKK